MERFRSLAAFLELDKYKRDYRYVRKEAFFGGRGF